MQTARRYLLGIALRRISVHIASQGDVQIPDIRKSIPPPSGAVASRPDEAGAAQSRFMSYPASRRQQKDTTFLHVQSGFLVVDGLEESRRFICSTLRKGPELQIVGEISDGLEGSSQSRRTATGLDCARYRASNPEMELKRLATAGSRAASD